MSMLTRPNTPSWDMTVMFVPQCRVGSLHVYKLCFRRQMLMIESLQFIGSTRTKHLVCDVAGTDHGALYSCPRVCGWDAYQP